MRSHTLTAWAVPVITVVTLVSTSCKLQAARYKLQAAGYKLQATRYTFTSYTLRALVGKQRLERANMAAPPGFSTRDT